MKLIASGMTFSLLLAFIACSSDKATDTRDAAADGSIRIDDSNLIPCEPLSVLQTVCQQCHSNPPTRGAPYPLVTRTDILTTRSGGVTRELMIAQLKARRMPLPPVTIEDGQRAALLQWLEDGAVAVKPQSCVDAGADAGADAADAADAADEDSGDLDSGDAGADTGAD